MLLFTKNIITQTNNIVGFSPFGIGKEG